MKKLKIVSQASDRLPADLSPEFIQMALETTLHYACKGIRGLAAERLSCVVNLSYLEPAAMQELNRQSRQVDQVTDVLSFPQFEFQRGFLAETPPPFSWQDPTAEDPEICLGDIVLCLDKAASQAEELGHSLTREAIFLMVHSMLHLIGYDHMNADDEAEMVAWQKQIMADLNLRETSEASLDRTPHAIRQAGFIALLGRPNLGKSTLLNQLTGQSLAITSYKPQTTRTLIRSVIQSKDRQYVFIDAPGIHRSRHALDYYMSKAISTAMNLADIIVLMIDARFQPRVEEPERRIQHYAREHQLPLILLMNKVDLLTDKTKLLPLMQAYQEAIAPDEIIPISALTGYGLDELLAVLGHYLPERGALFSEEDYTNQTEKQLAAEIIRRQVLLQMNEEIPHGTAVLIDDFQENVDGPDQERSLYIQASLICERENHKGMLVGKQGTRIRAIRLRAQEDISEALATPCSLELTVVVRKDWRRRSETLKSLGYDAAKLGVE